jgi:GT2 family glycosyltransferase
MGLQHDMVIVDDASTDDTVRLLRQYHPDAIIVNGTGDLYWAGGMRYGFDLKWCDRYTHLLVFNDDSDFDEASLIKGLNKTFNNKILYQKAVCVGAFVSRDKMESTYGAQKVKSRWAPMAYYRLPIKSEIQSGDTLNMNLAIIPKKVIEKIGFLDGGFSHSMADFDYGLRAKNNGFKIIQLPGYVGYCDRNPTTQTWKDRSLSISERIKKLHSKKGSPPKEYWHYLKRHAGWMFPAYLLYPYYSILKTGMTRKKK